MVKKKMLKKGKSKKKLKLFSFPTLNKAVRAESLEDAQKKVGILPKDKKAEDKKDSVK